MTMAVKNSEQTYCKTHGAGPFNKDSSLFIQHEKENDNDCEWEKYNPKKHNPDYDSSEIVADEVDEKSKNSQKVYDFAQSKIIKKVRSYGDNNRAYALVRINSHYKTIEIGEWESVQWLKSSYYNSTGEFYNDDLYKTSLSLISAHCINDEIAIERIYSRIAFVNNEIFYDLCNEKYELVKITKEGYSVIQIDQDTPLFRRKSSPLSQHTPKKSRVKNPLDDLCNLLRISQENKQLFKIHFVSLFLESYPIPIMIFHGEQGSAKSTITSTIKRIVDPSPENLASMPKKIDDLNIHLYNRYLSNFDNISYFDHEVSDNLCRAITGHTHIKRELYQNSKEIILAIQSRMILNGITPNVEFPDLMQRSIFYETRYISKDQRITEEEFNRKLDSLISALLHQVFSILSNTLSIYESVRPEIKSKERMADFTLFGECISRSIGYDDFTFLEGYKNNLDSNSLNAVESWPIISIISRIIQNRKLPFKIPVDELHQECVTIASSKDIDTKSKYSKFPKDEATLSKQFVRLGEPFRKLGYSISSYRYNKRDGNIKRGTRIITFSSSTHIQSKLESSKTSVSSVSLCQDKKQAQKTSKSDTGKKIPSVSSVSGSKSSKNNQKTSKSDTGSQSDTGSPNLPSVSKKDKSVPEIITDTVTQVTQQISYPKGLDKITHFKCNTCGSSWFEINETSRLSDETLLEIHKKQGHTIEYSDGSNLL